MIIHAFSSTIRRREMDAVLTCMVDEKIGPGELCKRLVQNAAEFLGAETNATFALRSPVVALKYALDALQLEKNSKVAISALAPSWHYYTLLQNGYIPVVIDVNPEDAQMPLDAISESVQSGVKAVLLFEALGLMPKMAELLERIPVPVIEDVSQSAGASSGGGKAGSFGTFSIMGMEEKDRITAGGGALLFTCQKRNGAPLKSSLALSGNSPCDLLPDINAALALSQLKEFAKNEERRQELHELFTKSLFSTRHKTFLHQSAEGDVNAIYGCMRLKKMLSLSWRFPIRLHRAVIVSGSLPRVKTQNRWRCAPCFSRSIRAFQTRKRNKSAKSFRLCPSIEEQ